MIQQKKYTTILADPPWYQKGGGKSKRGDQKGGSNKRESMEVGCSGFIHAEINALIKCDYNYPKKKKMYLTLSPCRLCAKAIVNAGISEVIYLEEYKDSNGIDVLKEAGILVRCFKT